MLTVLLLTLLATASTQNCPTADAYQCSSSLCSTYNWMNGTCQQASGYHCTTNQVPASTIGNCTDCSSLTSSQCSLICNNWYFKEGSGCTICSTEFGTNCVSCTSAGCTSCTFSSGTVLNTTSKRCQDISHCSIANCTSCYTVNSTDRCAICETGFKVTSSYQCQATNCTISYCSRCNQAGTACDSCSAGYTLNTDKKGCQAVCSVANCDICSTVTTCQTCIPGYNLIAADTCALNCLVQNCVSCASSTRCTTCTSGYTLVYEGTHCTNCSVTNCLVCSTTSEDTCFICATGYQLINGTSCSKDTCQISGCQICDSSNTTKCSECQAYYTLSSDNTLCNPNCLNSTSNCQLCFNDTTCMICNSGYALQSNGSCSKLCAINNCRACASRGTCLFCETGYALSVDKQTCSLSCSVSGCLTCNSSSECNACQAGYSFVSQTSCLLQCPSGQSNTGVSTISCIVCSSVLDNCQSCVSTEYCSECMSGYFLSGVSKCESCSIIANCKTCKTNTLCTSCQDTYTLNNNVCVSTNCSSVVTNCLSCDPDTVCLTCNTGYTKSNNSCIISCSSGYVFDTVSQSCICSSGTYQNNGACVQCELNCQVCDVEKCSTCETGYYADGKSCVACGDFCSSCFIVDNSISCQICQDGYYLYSGSCLQIESSTSREAVAVSTALIYQCPSGCSKCSQTVNNILTCTQTKNGYSLVSGSIILCDSSCKSCTGSSTTDCTACYPGMTLNNGVCENCSDSSAYSCQSTNNSYSITCRMGYTETNNSLGLCQACAANCRKCDVTGAGNCDHNECFYGYVRVIVNGGSFNCSACFKGCPTCSASDLGACTSCSQGQYLSNGECISCDSNCYKCSVNSTSCTACHEGKQLVQSGCYSIPIGCAKLSQLNPTQCEYCFDGYRISSDSSSCQLDACSSNCISCPDSYYLSSTSICVACPEISNCRNCNPNSTSLCLQCNSGYYSLNGVCLSCNTGCSQCLSLSFCTTASAGYFLELSVTGQNSGKVRTCSSQCATCRKDSKACTTCNAGSYLNGITCIRTVQNSLVLVLVNTNSSDSSANYSGDNTVPNGFANVNGLYYLVCSQLPSSFFEKSSNVVLEECQKYLVFNSMLNGSLVVDSTISGGNFTSEEEANDALSQAFAQGITLDTIQIISSSISSSGYITTSLGAGQSDNIGLILGLSVPVTIVFIIIIVILGLSKGRKEGEESQRGTDGETVEGVNYIDHESQNQIAN